MLRREKKLEHWAAIQLEVERRRHIHAYLKKSFSVERMGQALELLSTAMEFVPNVIIVDQPEFDAIDRETMQGLQALAEKAGAELWMSCRTHREDERPKAGHLPPPAEAVEDLIDVAFRLDPRQRRIRLKVLKDQQGFIEKDLNILLDPETLLLTTGVPRSKK
jgi:hypothetical protein